MRTVDVDPDRLAALFDRARRDVDEAVLPACQVAVACDGELVAEATFGAPDGRRFHAYSSGKVVVAGAVWLLLGEGRLRLEDRVADHVPEFAANGKEAATVRMMLDHSVGVPVLRGEVAPGELYDWDRMVARLEAEEPFWEPGTRNGYHMINFGWTVGEVVRRASGRSLGTFFREAIAEPLASPSPND